jgi:hypothetical protein
VLWQKTLFIFSLNIYCQSGLHFCILFEHFICRPSYSIESEDARIDLRTVAVRVVTPDSLNPDPVTYPDPAIQLSPDPDKDTDPDPGF